MGTLQAAQTLAQAAGAVPAQTVQDELCQAFRTALDSYCAPGFNPAKNAPESLFNNHLYRALRNQQPPSQFAGSIIREMPAMVNPNVAAAVMDVAAAPGASASLASRWLQAYSNESARLLKLGGLPAGDAILASDNISTWGSAALKTMPPNSNVIHLDGFIPGTPRTIIEIKGPLDSANETQAEKQQQICNQTGAQRVEVNCEQCGVEDQCNGCKKNRKKDPMQQSLFG